MVGVAIVYVAIWITRFVWIGAVVALTTVAATSAITFVVSIVAGNGDWEAALVRLHSSSVFQENAFIVAIIASLTWLLALLEQDVRSLNWRAFCNETKLSDVRLLLTPQ